MQPNGRDTTHALTERQLHRRQRRINCLLTQQFTAVLTQSYGRGLHGPAPRQYITELTIIRPTYVPRSAVAAIQVVQVVRCTRAHYPWGPTSEDQIAIF